MNPSLLGHLLEILNGLNGTERDWHGRIGPLKGYQCARNDALLFCGLAARGAHTGWGSTWALSAPWWARCLPLRYEMIVSGQLARLDIEKIGRLPNGGQHRKVGAARRR